MGDLCCLAKRLRTNTHGSQQADLCPLYLLSVRFFAVRCRQPERGSIQAKGIEKQELTSFIFSCNVSEESIMSPYLSLCVILCEQPCIRRGFTVCMYCTVDAGCWTACGSSRFLVAAGEESLGHGGRGTLPLVPLSSNLPPVPRRETLGGARGAGKCNEQGPPLLADAPAIFRRGATGDERGSTQDVLLGLR